jgi:hypothetical protein
MIVAGCGGSGLKTRVLAGNGFTFEAPFGWQVETSARSTSASNGKKVVQASVLPLARAYTPSLFEQVQPEIERVATALKEQLKSTIAGRTVQVAGDRAWQYDLTRGDTVWQVTFFLRGKREFQLYCRRTSRDSNAPCSKLVSSFKLR